MQIELNKNVSALKGEYAKSVFENGIMITPQIDEDFWYFRVKLSDNQAIVGFPKFDTIGIGFQKEEDWNTNLPYRLPAEDIYNHIKHNKGDKNIKKADCINAIKMIQTASQILLDK